MAELGHELLVGSASGVDLVEKAPSGQVVEAERQPPV